MTALPTPLESPTVRDYRYAAGLLWGIAGTFLVDEYQALNARYFADELPPRPIVIGLVAYGGCLGLTRHDGPWIGPRITIAPELFRRGTRHVADVLLHEMIHTKLILAGEYAKHNGQPWCRELMRLSPLVLGVECQAEPIHPRRIRDAPTGKSSTRRQVRAGFLSRAALAGWPASCRPGGGDPGPVLSTASY